jgi:tight adherence protein C
MQFTVFSALVFVALSLALSGLYFLLVPTRAEQRLQVITAAQEKSHWTEKVVKVAGPFAKLSAPQGDWDTSLLRVRFLNAGVRHPSARVVYFAGKTLLPLLFGGVALFALRATHQWSGTSLLFLVLLAALVGCYLPNIVVNRLIKYRQRDIFENFPDAADLMLICVEAGLGLDAALTKVAEEIRRDSVALAEELHLTNLEMRAGATREKALHNLALRTGVEEVGTFATMLTQADKFGTAVGESLRVFSDDLRQKRQVRVEELAAKVPTKLLFPLVLCIFPSIIMVVMGPAAVQILRTMGPLLHGGN